MKLLHQNTQSIQFQFRNTLDFPQHLHDVLEIVFLRRGTATAIYGNRRYSLRAGDVFVSFPNCAHGYEESREVACDVVILPVTELSTWRSQLAQKRPVFPVLSQGSWEHTGLMQIMDMIRSEKRTLTDPVKQGYALVLAGKLLPLMELEDRGTGTGDALQRLLEYLAEHYREPLSRREIAQAVGYNESYISHVLTEQFGVSLKTYLTTLRLQDAPELLTDTDMSVSQISLHLGFGSIRSFNRAFAREFSCNPTTYRFQRNLIDK